MTWIGASRRRVEDRPLLIGAGRFTDDLSLPGALALFLTTTAVLGLELLQMRLLSFMLWHHLAYMVISMALLGLGAGGVWLSVRRERIMMAADAWLVSSVTLAGVTTVLAFALLARVELDTFRLSAGEVVRLALAYGVLALPYLFVGLALGIVFTRGVARIGTLYAVDLLGSAAGAWVFFVAIEPLGAPRALIALSALLCLAGLLFAVAARSPALGAVAGVALAALALAVGAGDRLIPAHAAGTKGLSTMLRAQGGRIVYSRWTPIARIDVVESEQPTNPFTRPQPPGSAMKAITIDGDATTWMWRARDLRVALAHPTNYHAAFLLKKSPEALIIGPGGGSEIFVARQMGAAHVIGVELNPVILDMSLRRYADFVGNIYQSPAARAVVGEGRSYVRQTDRTFDIIQMSGVDTWSGLSSGAYVLSENYLYTVDAFVDFLTHLKPDGILSVVRWRMKPPRECLRLVSLAAAALRDVGVSRPQAHIVLVTLEPEEFVALLVKRSPFSREEVRIIQEAVRRVGGTLFAAPGVELESNAYQVLLQAFASGRERTYLSTYQYDVTPVRDDQPFFFEYYRWDRLGRDLKARGGGGSIGANRPVALVVLGALLVQSAVLSALLVLLPLWLFRRRGVTVPHAGAVVGYFSAIGLGFMFVEVALMQRFVLFLGHPAFSIPVVLASLLVAAGLGSLLGPRLVPALRARLGLAAFGVAAWLLVSLVLLPLLFDALLGAPFVARVAVTAAVLAVPGFLMGMFFPLGLAVVAPISEEAVPWAWGINGVASVVGSILVIAVAIGEGFGRGLVWAAGLYLFAALVLWPLTASADRGRARM